MGPASVVSTPAQLDDALEDAMSSPRVGLDTEFLRERTYRARLCLVQLATPRSIYVIDPLAIEDLSPLRRVLEGSPEVVVHAGKQDLEIFFDLFGSVPRSVFDVQVAAGFAGFGASLAYGRLVEAALGVTLVKGESYSDWCVRPLTEAQLSYAADDVRYLLELAERLEERLETSGRLAWVRQELAGLSSPESYGTDPDEAWRRVAGRGSLSGRQLAVLRAVARWREEAAARRDVPRGWIIKDPTLVEIARRAPRTRQALGSIRGLNAKEVERNADPILAAVRAGVAAPAPTSAPSPPKSAQVRARMLAGLADAVVRARSERAGIATELVSTRSELESLLAELFWRRGPGPGTGDGRHRLLRGWRKDLAGDAVVALARGRVAVRAIESPPYIEEVPVGSEQVNDGSSSGMRGGDHVTG